MLFPVPHFHSPRKYDLPVALVLTGDSGSQAENCAVGNSDNWLSDGHYVSSAQLCHLVVTSLTYNKQPTAFGH